MPLGRSSAFPSFLCVHRDAYLYHMHSRYCGPVVGISFCCFSFHSGPIWMLPGPVRMLPCLYHVHDDPDIPTPKRIIPPLRKNICQSLKRSMNSEASFLALKFVFTLIIKTSHTSLLPL